MKRPVLLPALFLPFAPLLSLASLGCNTAQISQAAVIDAGPPCESITPSRTCDGGGAPTPGACAGSVPVELDAPDASNTIPQGSYPLGCTVSFFYQDPASAQCNRAPACTCVTPDGGDEDSGVWSCTPTQ
jgi:hypothetical protein